MFKKLKLRLLVRKQYRTKINGRSIVLYIKERNGGVCGPRYDIRKVIDGKNDRPVTTYIEPTYDALKAAWVKAKASL